MIRLILGIALLIFTVSPLYAADEAFYYAKCNLRAHWHNVSAENWLGYEVGIPAGAKITSTTGSTLNFVTDSGEAFEFPSGPHDKYLQSEPLDLVAMPQDVQLAIKSGEPVAGITKEQVLISLCAPAYVLKGLVTREVTETEKLTLDEVKAFDLWVYRRKRIGKKLWIQFDDKGAVEKIFWGVL